MGTLETTFRPDVYEMLQQGCITEQDLSDIVNKFYNGNIDDFFEDEYQVLKKYVPDGFLDKNFEWSLQCKTSNGNESDGFAFNYSTIDDTFYDDGAMDMINMITDPTVKKLYQTAYNNLLSDDSAWELKMGSRYDYMDENVVKIKESKLRKMIREAINEYRSSSFYDNGVGGDEGYDGDHWYVNPNGKTPDGLDSYMGNSGKRGKANLAYKNSLNNKRELSTTSSANKYSHGKGELCIELQHSLDDILFGNKKVVWTDTEKKMIEDIEIKIGELAALTKKEGNKKRGYVKESQLRNIIKESICGILTEMGAFRFDDPCDVEYIKAMFSYSEDKLGLIKWKQFLLNQSNEDLLAWKECAEKVLDDYKFNPKYRAMLKLLDRRGLLRKR